VGGLSAGYADAIDAVLLAELMGQPSTTASALAARALLEATLGRPDECRAHAAEAIRRRPDNLEIRAQAEHALGYAALAAGDHPVAVVHLDRARRLVHAHGVVEPAAVPATADLAEAQTRSGDAAAARATLRRLDRMVQRTGRRGQRAAALRVRAMLAPGQGADALFRAALAEHAGVGAPLEQARARLAYGDWLVHAGRAEQAGRELSAAVRVFQQAGARSWAERAAGSLDRLGLRPPAAPDHAASLSGIPWRIAWAIAQGRSPREIASQVLLSVRTVEFHLAAALSTLGLRSAAELADRFGADAGRDRGSGPGQARESW
jgi:ATP/maltotriose-dependent transcriptional regulator MalT